MCIQGLENFIRDQAAIGCQGILRLFAVFLIFFVEEGERFFDKIEAEKGLSPVEVEVVKTGQKRQKKRQCLPGCGECHTIMGLLLVTIGAIKIAVFCDLKGKALDVH